jgi:hypothetical protein
VNPLHIIDRQMRSMRRKVKKRWLVFTLALIPTPFFAQTSPFPTSLDTNATLGVPADSVSSALTSPQLIGDTTAQVANATRIPQWSLVTYGAELEQVCLKSGNTLTFGTPTACPSIAGRGLSGTTIAAHNTGVIGYLNINGYYHQATSSAIMAVETDAALNMPKPQWWGAKGDGSHNDTAAIQSCFNNVLHSCYLPKGIYMVDPDVITITGTGWQAFIGEGAGLYSTGVGVQIKARSSGTNLVTIYNKIGAEIDHIAFLGNNLATYPVRIEDQTSDLVFRDAVFGTAASGGCNVLIQPASGFNTQIDYIEFHHANFAGAIGSTGVCNLSMRNNQTLRLTLYNPSFQATAAISESIHLEAGTMTLYSPTFTGTTTGNTDINHVSGNISTYEMRSESSTTTPIVVGQSAGYFDHENAVVVGGTGLTVNPSFAGTGIVRGGQWSSITNNSTTPILIDFVTKLSGAVFTGPHGLIPFKDCPTAPNPCTVGSQGSTDNDSGYDLAAGVDGSGNPVLLAGVRVKTLSGASGSEYGQLVLGSKDNGTYHAGARLDSGNLAPINSSVLPPFLVANLGTCGTSQIGQTKIATNLAANTLNIPAAGTGTFKRPVVCDGSNWVTF